MRSNPVIHHRASLQLGTFSAHSFLTARSLRRNRHCRRIRHYSVNGKQQKSESQTNTKRWKHSKGRSSPKPDISDSFVKCREHASFLLPDCFSRLRRFLRSLVRWMNRAECSCWGTPAGQPAASTLGLFLGCAEIRGFMSLRRYCSEFATTTGPVFYWSMRLRGFDFLGGSSNSSG